jgi:peptide/nickel transport system substrate-binding protein
VTWRNRSRAARALPLLAALAACNGARVPDGQLVVLMDQPASSIDPRYCVQAADFKVSRMVYAPLVSTDNAKLEPQMELAESVHVIAGSNDWAIALRAARFSDGKPVTSDDVLYTFETLRDPKNSGAAARIRRSMAEAGLTTVEKIDDLHVVAHLSKPHAPFITDLNFGLMERPRPGTSRDADPVGAGAFVLDRRDGETWILKPNNYYYKGKPKIDSLVFKTIRDDNSRLLALTGGSGDLTQNTVSPLLIDAVADNPRLTVAGGSSSVYSYIGLNCEDPILKDVRVRRAIAYAIDRAQIVHTTLHDRAVLATGMLQVLHWAYEKDVDDYKFDPERAKQLLDEAGHPDPDGDGPLPRFTLVYKTSNIKLRVAIASVIADMLRRVGIGVELRVNEFATFFADVKKGNFQMFSMQIPEISEPDLYIHFFKSTRIPTRENLDAGGNRARYRNPELDALIDRGRETLDRDERKKIYSQIQRILARDVPVVSLWHEDNLVAMRKQVRGYQILPTAQMSSLDRTYKVARSPR